MKSILVRNIHKIRRSATACPVFSSLCRPSSRTERTPANSRRQLLSRSARSRTGIPARTRARACALYIHSRLYCVPKRTTVSRRAARPVSEGTDSQLEGDLHASKKYSQPLSASLSRLSAITPIVLAFGSLSYV